MTRTASGRSAFIIAAGLLACLWGPLHSAPATAAPQDDAAQATTTPETATPVAKKKVPRSHAKQVKKKPAPAKQAKPTAENTGDDAKSASKTDDKTKDQSKLAASPLPRATPQDEAQAAAEPPASSALPPSVANANAQFPQIAAADGTAPGATVPAAPPVADPQAPTTPPNVQVMPADEVNELDRAAAETAGAPAVMATNTASPATAAAPPSTVGTAQVSSATGNDGAWDKASLIGKIFIAAGGLLALASAARMFMA